MPNRTAKFIFLAVIAGLCDGIPLTASQGATPAPAADECLLAPRNETPDGSHWYYRIEHPSNRHCWYLRGEGDAHAQAAPSNAPASAQPVSSTPDKAMPGSVANARAELRLPRPGIDQDRAVNTGQVPATASAAVIDTAPPATPADSNMRTSVVASRWPDQLSANAAAAPAPQPAPANPPFELQADASPAPPSVAAPPAAAPLAVADASMAKQSGSAVMLFAVIVGALSVAALVASMVFRSGSKRRARAPALEEVRPVWDLDRDLKRRRAPLPAAAVNRPNIGAPLELQEADDPDERDRIAQMLERLARSAQG